MRMNKIGFFDKSKKGVIATNDVIEPFDGSNLYNIKPASVQIDFTNENADNVAWNIGKTIATFTHSLNCYPIVQVYNGSGVQVYPIISVIDGNTFSLDFAASNPVDDGETWKCAVTYGAEYGNTGDVNSDVATVLQTAQLYVDRCEEVKDAIIKLFSFEVGNATGHGVTVDGNLLSFTWTDPDDNITVDGAVLARWGKTRLVMKTGGFPENEEDGTILVDNTVRYQYRETPFIWDAGVTSNYYFALFTCTTDGVWNTGDTTPRFTTDLLTWQTIAMLTRANSLLTYPGMEIGAVVNVPVSTQYPKLRYKLAHVNYSAHHPTCADWHYDHTKHYNSVWIPNFLPCLDTSNTALQIQFDAPETSYGHTWDTVFVEGKSYYRYEDTSYVLLAVGTDYETGDEIATFESEHGYYVYTKNHSNRVSNGCNSWKESNMRQWLNASGNNWFEQQNEYDVKSLNAGYNSGWMTGFDPAFLSIVQPVYNKTARNTVSAISGGGGGGYDITLDKFWLPSEKEVFNTNVNSIAEGAQFDYFANVATTTTLRTQKDEGGAARIVWLRSPYVSNTIDAYSISTSGSSNYRNVSTTYAVFPAVCIA